MLTSAVCGDIQDRLVSRVKTDLFLMVVLFPSHSPPSAQPCRSVEQVIGSLNITFHWPQADHMEIASLQCPCDAFPELTKDAFASRMCGAGGQWLEANVEACAFDKRDTFCKVCTSGTERVHKLVDCKVASAISLLLSFPLQDGINVLVTCDGMAASLSGSEVAMLTNAWAELLTQDSVDDDRVSKLIFTSLSNHIVPSVSVGVVESLARLLPNLYMQ